MQFLVNIETNPTCSVLAATDELDDVLYNSGIAAKITHVPESAAKITHVPESVVSAKPSPALQLGNGDLVCPQCGNHSSGWQICDTATRMWRGVDTHETTWTVSGSYDTSDGDDNEWVECTNCLTRIEIPSTITLEWD
jgi:hypothetical protein